MKYTRGIYSSGTQTHTLTVYAVCSNETINGVDEITMKFLHKVEQYPPALDGRSFSTSTHFIIGAQQSMSYSLTHNNITYTYTILDWIYSNEPEGDGYIAPTESTGHGSNYDDRFPLITTNLFNRQRSVYAIGMTHKDTWDLFL